MVSKLFLLSQWEITAFFVLTPNNMGASVPLRKKKQECKLGRRLMVASTIKPKNKVKNSVYGVFPFWVAQ